MKILITGGHLTPALSTIDYVLSQKKDSIIFVGRKFSQTASQQRSVEKEEVEKRGVPFKEFDSGKVDLTQPLQLPYQFFKFLGSFIRASSILKQEQPDLFLSFGGYLAVPFALAAWLRRIPVITHEQTAAPGTANRFIAHFATKIAISFPETASSFPKNKVILTGNPIRQGLWQKKTRPAWATPASQRPFLYIAGGSQGSQAINRTIQLILPELLKEWDVLHQCGKSTSTNNYKQELEAAATQSAKELASQYVVREWISEEELGWVYQQAWGMISRAGANTVQEVIFAQIPTIFIPLAHARNDEQSKNAMSLVQRGGAIYLAQRELDEPHLLAALNELKKNHEELKAKLQSIKAAQIANADELLYQVMEKVGHEK
jgi:UDP-N-acetylglucosamine--N-acetylmuramyl-(pentapeptide) pyrophosphoryl-undecaprenol N-acetylglucosamine transferase